MKFLDSVQIRKRNYFSRGLIIYNDAEWLPEERRAISLKPFLRRLMVVILIIGLNWFSLLAVGKTFGLFSDTESSSQNEFTAGALSFSLESEGDFTSACNVDSQRTINILNQGNSFKYVASSTEFSSPVCNYINLKANLSGDGIEYDGPLTGFNSGLINFSENESWVFDATTSPDLPANLQGQTCTFKFVFNGSQTRNNLPFGEGFTDTEEIINNISACGQGGPEEPKIVINKVYYKVDSKHGTDPANEWVELYNPTELPLDISNWVIADNNSSDVLASSSPIIIPALGFALISGTSTTWNYWQIPSGVVKIVLADGEIGNGLDNTADMLILKDSDGNIADQMNWGLPNLSWPNYNSGVWHPGAVAALPGQMLARYPNGFDTDQASDWLVFTPPVAKMIVPNGGEVWYVAHTYELKWTAANFNGPDSDLSIDLYYSKDSGATWAAIATSTENDGSFLWKIPLSIDGYLTVSSRARIKVVATGPENFMVQDWDMSDRDFCPPVDFTALFPIERELLAQLIAQGLIDESEVIYQKSAINDNGVNEIAGGNTTSEPTGIELPSISAASTTAEEIVNQPSNENQETSLAPATSTESGIEGQNQQPAEENQTIEETSKNQAAAKNNSEPSGDGREKISDGQAPVILQEPVDVPNNQADVSVPAGGDGNPSGGNGDGGVGSGPDFIQTTADSAIL